MPVKPKVPMDELSKYILENCDEVTPKEMAAHLGLELSTIHVYANKLGISLLSKETIKRRARVDQFIRRYAGRKTISQLAKMIDESDYMIRYRAKKMGIDMTIVDSVGKKISKLIGGMEMFNAGAYSNWLIG